MATNDTADLISVLSQTLPAALPDVGPVIDIEEAVCWLAYDRPSFDIDVCLDVEGKFRFFTPDQVELNSHNPEDRTNLDFAYMHANTHLHGALREGVLLSFVQNESGNAIRVPRLYWNGSMPEQLELACRSSIGMEDISGKRLLLSRADFQVWRIGHQKSSLTHRENAVTKAAEAMSAAENITPRLTKDQAAISHALQGIDWPSMRDDVVREKLRLDMKLNVSQRSWTRLKALLKANPSLANWPIVARP